MKSMVEVVQYLLKPYIDSQIQTLTNDEQATRESICAITNDANTNTQGSVIASGTQFYKNGVLYKATSDIAVGGTLTLGSNYKLAGSVTAQITQLLSRNMPTVYNPVQHTYTNVLLTSEYRTVTLSSAGAYNTNIPLWQFIRAIPDGDDKYCIVRASYDDINAVIVCRNISDNSAVTGNVGVRLLYMG